MLSLFLSFSKHSFPKITFSDLGVALLFLYIAVRLLFQSASGLNVACILLSGLFTYFFIKVFLKEHGSQILIHLIATAICLVSIIFSSSFLIRIGTGEDNFFLPNNSVLGVLLVSQVSFLTPLILANKKYRLVGWLRAMSIAVLVMNIVIIIFSRSRTAWLAMFFVAFVYLFLFVIHTLRLRKLLVICFSVVFIALFYVLFLVKRDSSEGRLFIYKVSRSMINVKTFVLGVGVGKFKTNYNLYQARYFGTHDINGKEGWLADNTEFAFNDYLQIFIEGGALEIALFLFLIYLAVSSVIRKYQTNRNDTLFRAGVSAFSCILFSASFSYPFEIIPIAILGIMSLSIINSGDQKAICSFPTIAPGFLVIISLSLILYSITSINYYCNFRQASILRREGYLLKSEMIYSKLYESCVKDGDMLYEYAELLFLMRRMNKAEVVINQCKKYNVKEKVFSLAASIASDQKDPLESERNLLTAVFIVPNRVIPRANLLNFYIESGQNEKAFYWANAIQEMQIKVASPMTERIRNEAMHYLRQYDAR